MSVFISRGYLTIRFMASHKVFEDEAMKSQEQHDNSTDLPSEIDQ